MIGRGFAQFISMVLALASCQFVCVLAQSLPGKYAIQIAAVSTEAEALAIAGRNRAAGIETPIVRHDQPDGRVLYRLQIGCFASRVEADRAGRDLLNRGIINDYFITRTEDKKSNGAVNGQALTSRNELAEKLEGGRSWTMLGFGPVASALREIALARPQYKIEVADDVLRLVARSAGAAAVAARERSSGMLTFRNRLAGYSYSRPRDWRESETSEASLREERIQAGELFIAPDAAAFLGSGYRSFEKDYDGYVPVRSLTPAVLIEKLMGKLRRLPGVHEARVAGHTESAKEGVERIEVEIELGFLPAANEPAVPFIGKALVLRDENGVFELIGLWSRFSSANAARIIEKSISSATLR